MMSIRLYATVFYRSVIDAIKSEMMIYGGYAAYTSILALFPFIIFLVALSSVFGDAKLAEVVIQKGFEYLPAEAVNTLAPVVRNIMGSDDSAVLSIAAIGTLWVASSGIEGLRSGLNLVYEVREPRPLWKRRLQAIFFVLLGSVGFLVLATILIVWPLIEQWLGGAIPLLTSGILAFVRYLFAFGVLVFVISLMYYYLPNKRSPCRQILPGAVVASAIWLALAAFFAYYVANYGNYAAHYGSIAGIIIMLIFLQLSATALLFGGQFNVTLLRLRKR